MPTAVNHDEQCTMLCTQVAWTPRSVCAVHHRFRRVVCMLSSGLYRTPGCHWLHVRRADSILQCGRAHIHAARAYHMCNTSGFPAFSAVTCQPESNNIVYPLWSVTICNHPASSQYLTTIPCCLLIYWNTQNFSRKTRSWPYRLGNPDIWYGCKFATL